MSDRVALRQVGPGDRDEFVELMKRSRRLHDPWIVPPTTGRMFDRYLQRIAQSDHEGMLICLKTTNAIVGVINVNNIVRGSFLSASLGYYAGEPYAGQGYMQEGLQLLVQHAFKELGLHRLEANIQPDNHRSLELVRRCGFEWEGLSKAFLFINGQWRDHERWVLLDRRRGLLR